MPEPHQHGGRSGLFGQLTAMADAVGKVLPAMGEAVVRTVAATGELLTDGSLRRKGVELIVNETAKGLEDIQKGLEDKREQVSRAIQEGAKAHFGAGARQVQALLRKLERQIERQQRARQQADGAGGELVDIQVGDQVFEDMPLQLRSRLWYVLLEAPQLAEPLRPISGPGRRHAKPQRSAGVGSSPSTPNAAAASAPTAAGAAAQGQAATALATALVPPSAPNPWRDAPNPWGGPEPSHGADPGRVAAPATGPAVAGQQSQATTSRTSSSSTPGVQAASAAGPPSGDAGAGAGHEVAAAAVPSQGSTEVGASTSSQGKTSTAADAAASDGSNANGDWEVVARSISGSVSASGHLDAMGRVAAALEEAAGTSSSSGASGSEAGPSSSAAAAAVDDGGDAVRSAKQRLFTAMQEVPWLPREGIPRDIDPLGEYQRALALECPAADDIISRDIARTFPDHPFFKDPAGQATLWRVLHAYATTDPEVGYCQGMGFCAGVLLMYVPEEVAWRLFCRLMGPAPGGCNLRRLYLPGLNPLKEELSRFELLLASHLPELHAHLMGAGLPSVLYASQWIMTQFCCPFPVHFAARLLDVMLQEGHDGVLPRVSLALMESMAAELLALEDFEELITHVKVAPLSWPLHTYRQLLDAALDSPVSASELEAAAAAVQAELARLGRPSSFRDASLQRCVSSGGTVGHQLVGHQQEEAAEGAEVDPTAGGAGGVDTAVGEEVGAGSGGGVVASGGSELGSVAVTAAAAAQLDVELLDSELGLGLLLPLLHPSGSQGEEGEGSSRGGTPSPLPTHRQQQQQKEQQVAAPVVQQQQQVAGHQAPAPAPASEQQQQVQQ